MNIKDYLPYYIGCRVLIDDKEYGTLVGGSFVPNSVDQIYYHIITDEAAAEGDDFHMPYNDDTSPDCRVKPLLRRLSDMTEGEKIFICHLHMIPGWRSLSLLDDCDTDWGMRVEDKDGNRKSLYIRKDRLTPKLFHYLLKQGFDLWGLIDAGMALDLNTIKK